MGELARKPGAPTLPSTPLELLAYRETDKLSFIEYYLIPTSGMLCGLGYNFWNNFSAKRPFYAGAYLYPIYGVLGWFTFSLIRDWKYQAKMENDEVLRHYVTLHPDEFPPFERKRIGELFLKWSPMR